MSGELERVTLVGGGDVTQRRSPADDQPGTDIFGAPPASPRMCGATSRLHGWEFLRCELDAGHPGTHKSGLVRWRATEADAEAAE